MRDGEPLREPVLARYLEGFAGKLKSDRECALIGISTRGDTQRPRKAVWVLAVPGVRDGRIAEFSGDVGKTH